MQQDDYFKQPVPGRALIRANREIPIKLFAILESDAVAFGLNISCGDQQLHATGSSKRHPSDDYDEVLGLALAQSRAFRAAADALDDFAKDRVAKNDQKKAERRKMERALEIRQEERREHLEELNRKQRELQKLDSRQSRSEQLRRRDRIFRLLGGR